MRKRWERSSEPSKTPHGCRSPQCPGDCESPAQLRLGSLLRLGAGTGLPNQVVRRFLFANASRIGHDRVCVMTRLNVQSQFVPISNWNRSPNGPYRSLCAMSPGVQGGVLFEAVNADRDDSLHKTRFKPWLEVGIGLPCKEDRWARRRPC